MRWRDRLARRLYRRCYWMNVTPVEAEEAFVWMLG